MKNDKATWFREKGATTTLMVPATTNSALAKRLRKEVANHAGPKGTSVKILERPGRPIFSTLRAKPTEIECNNKNCPIVHSGKDCNNQCRQENILYSAHCTICRTKQEDIGIKPDNVTDSLYLGESSRTLKIRSQQHRQYYRKCLRQHQQQQQNNQNKQQNNNNTTTQQQQQQQKQQQQNNQHNVQQQHKDNETHSSFMWDHIMDKHEDHIDNIDINNDFHFQILSRHTDPMTRLVSEAMRIETALKHGIHYNFKGEKIKTISINRKEEHFTSIKRKLD